MIYSNFQNVFNQHGIAMMSPGYHMVRDGEKEK